MFGTCLKSNLMYIVFGTGRDLHRNLSNAVISRLESRCRTFIYHNEYGSASFDCTHSHLALYDSMTFKQIEWGLTPETLDNKVVATVDMQLQFKVQAVNFTSLPPGSPVYYRFTNVQLPTEDVPPAEGVHYSNVLNFFVPASAMASYSRPIVAVGDGVRSRCCWSAILLLGCLTLFGFVTVIVLLIRLM